MVTVGYSERDCLLHNDFSAIIVGLSMRVYPIVPPVGQRDSGGGMATVDRRGHLYCKDVPVGRCGNDASTGFVIN